MSNSTPQIETLLDEFADATLSSYGGNFTQNEAAKKRAIKARKALSNLLIEAELNTELRVHDRYETVPLKNLRSHMEARKNIVQATLKNKEEI